MITILLGPNKKMSEDKMRKNMHRKVKLKILHSGDQVTKNYYH